MARRRRSPQPSLVVLATSLLHFRNVHLSTVYAAPSKLFKGAVSALRNKSKSAEKRTEMPADDKHQLPTERRDVSIAQVSEMHPNEWVLLQVTGHDQNRLPDQGVVVAHSPRRAAISEALAQHAPSRQPMSRPPLYVFHTPSLASQGEDDPGDAMAGLIDLFVAGVEDVPHAEKRR